MTAVTAADSVTAIAPDSSLQAKMAKGRRISAGTERSIRERQSVLRMLPLP